MNGTEASSTIRLEDGRDLEFAEYGDPDGRPVLFFHGFLGSRHQASWAAQEAGAAGLRLIAPNRPGVGRSTPHRYDNVADFTRDVEQLCAALGVEDFGLLALSGGCPFALACACRLPGRVRLVGVVSGLGPFEDGLLWQMASVPRFALLLSRHCPPLARWLLWQRARHHLGTPGNQPPRLIVGGNAGDQAALADPELEKLFLADIDEVLVRGGGVRSLVWEMQLFFRWGFRLEDVPATTPVFFWHGNDDLVVPPSMARHMAARIPGSEVYFLPGGHYLAVHVTGEVLEQMARCLREGKPVRQPVPAAGTPTVSVAPQPVAALAALAG